MNTIANTIYCSSCAYINTCETATADKANWCSLLHNVDPYTLSDSPLQALPGPCTCAYFNLINTYPLLSLSLSYPFSSYFFDIHFHLISFISYRLCLYGYIIQQRLLFSCRTWLINLIHFNGYESYPAISSPKICTITCQFTCHCLLPMANSNS